MKVKNIAVAGNRIPCIEVNEELRASRSDLSCLVWKDGIEYVPVYNYLHDFMHARCVYTLYLEVSYNTISHILTVTFGDKKQNINVLNCVVEALAVKGDTECIGIVEGKVAIATKTEE